VRRYQIIHSIVWLLLGLLTSGCSISSDADDQSSAPTLVSSSPAATAMIPRVGAVDLTRGPDSPTTSGASTATEPTTIALKGQQTLVAPSKPDRAIVTGNQSLTLAGSESGPETLDPALIRDAESSFFVRQIFRGLVRIDNNLLTQPDIAERIVVSADGRTYTFHLRDNATFHDGSPIDARAVVASFNRASDPALTGGDGYELPAAIYLTDIDGVAERLSGERDTITGISAIDDRTVQVTLVQPTANFLYKLTGSPAQVVDVTSTETAEWWRKPNGSGPFVLDSWNSSEMRLIGFDAFYDGAPLLDEVIVILGQAAFQPLNLYESGRIDVTETPLYAIDRVLSESDPLHTDLTIVPQLSTSFILLNPNSPPFSDPIVREAIVLAFESSKIARISLDGKVTVAEGIVPPGILDRTWPADIPHHDLEAARNLIAAAGELDRPPAFFGSGAAISLATVLERDLGIETDAIEIDWPEFSRRLGERSLPAFALTWVADFPDPANFLTSLFLTGSPDNYIGYSNPDVDRLLRQAEIELDSANRQRMYLDAQQLIVDDHVLIPLYHDVSYTLIQPWVRDLTVTPIGVLSLEDVWIDD
jgi:peptide/nickel transport system substrate-binding protein/oligopeptide transport system substrate-binding protein